MTLTVLALLLSSHNLAAPVEISVEADRPLFTVSRDLYGIFFEEINQAGEGGLYAELIRNRGLEQNADEGLPAGWKADLEAGAGTVSLDESAPLNEAHRRSIHISKSGAGRIAASNEGFWGIPVRKGARYRLTTWVKGDSPLELSLDGPSGTVADSKVPAPGKEWKRIEQVLTAESDSTKSKLSFLPTQSGDTWIAYASLIPADTWKGRRNGMRKDLAETVDAMHPAFVRFPGGCYVEGGDRLSDAFDWKRSILPMDEREGLAHSMWGYPNSFGLGYHEYLQWCEDMGSAPLFVVNCGMCHRQIVPMDEMGKYVQDTLDAIEYANGPVSSKWGTLRAKNGHPKPFGLKYIEIGNENGANWSFGGPPPYADRYKLIFDAIKKVHPEITTIADNPVPHPMEFVDEHYYEDPGWFWRNSGRYDSYDRRGPKIYVGEYAVTRGCGQGNLVAALGEAAFMTGMERNSDIVRMSSYAPLFVNVNNRQWNPDAIVFDDARSYGTPSYHVQALFANNRADRVVKYSVRAPEAPPPAIGGGIGLGTWRTQSEYKDVELTVDGKKAYSSSGIGQDGIESVRGDWKVENGVIRQNDLNQNRLARLKGIDLTGVKSYVLTLKARKISGAEGFMIMLDNRGDGALDWNIGGWNNAETAFQRNGDVLGRSLRQKIDTDRWYDIRLEREGNRVRGYLDGKLTQEAVETGSPDFTAVAGIDDGAHELVLKVVNGSDEARTCKLNLSGGRIGREGRAIVLTGPSLTAENTFENPKLIAPATSRVGNIRPDMSYTFVPRSVTVLRIPMVR